MGKYILGTGGIAFARERQDIPRIGWGMRAMSDFSNEASIIGARLQNALPVTSLVSDPRNTTAACVDIDIDGKRLVAPQFVGDFVFKLTIPRKNQGLPSAYSGYFVEEVEVNYNGVGYCFFASAPESWSAADMVGLLRYDWHLYGLVRVLLSNILDQDPSSFVKPLEPSLVHFSIQIEIDTGSIESGKAIIENRLLPENDMFIRVRTPQGRDDQDVVRGVAYAAASLIAGYYELAERRQRRDRLAGSINQSLANVSSLYSERTQIASWQLWRTSRFTLSRRMRQIIGQALIANAHLAAMNIDLMQSTRSWRQQVLADDLMSSSADYLAEDIEADLPFDVTATLAALRFFEEETRSSASLDIVIITSLIAALVSALIAGVFTFA